MVAPDRGDLVWLDFSPQAGREQAGRRPALVLSPKAYNDLVGLVIACAITSKVKNRPFDVPLPVGLPIQGVVLSDHVRSIDWRARNAQLIAKIPPRTLQAVRDRLATLLDDDP